MRRMRYPPRVNRLSRAALTFVASAFVLGSCVWLDEGVIPCEQDPDCFAGWHCGGDLQDPDRYCEEGAVTGDDDDSASDDDDSQTDA